MLSAFGLLLGSGASYLMVGCALLLRCLDFGLWYVATSWGWFSFRLGFVFEVCLSSTWILCWVSLWLLWFGFSDLRWWLV